MLLGQYKTRISGKFQVSLPKKFRDELGTKIIVTKGLEACLIIVSEEKWKTLLEGTEGRPFTNENARMLQRFLLGNAYTVELDRKGRFVLPEYLRMYANIEEPEAVFVGVERFCEMWSVRNWDKMQEKLAANIISVAQRLSEKNEN